MLRPRSIALLLALVTLAVFLPVGRFDFVNFDDNEYVTENPFVSNGLTGTDIRWAFTAAHSGNWHPLTWLSHMTDCELFKLNAGAHHFDSVLFHAANVALLFILLFRLTRGLWAAVFIAALFAWHPVHVESVAWISERKDVLSTFFALLSLLSYVKYVELSRLSSGSVKKPGRGFFYCLCVLFFAFGLMSKPMLVTLPFVMLLLDWWPLRRVTGDGLRMADVLLLVLEKVPLFVLTAASCVITYFVQGEAVVTLTGVPLHYRLQNAPVAAVNYILKLFWPVDLSAFYPLVDHIPKLQVALSVAVLILISIAAWHWRKSKPYFLIGWLWFLGTLVPVIGIMQVGAQAMADRYTYIPSIGFFLALVFLARDLATRLQMPKVVAAGLMVLVCAACILATEKQLPYWRDGETLFRRALAVNPPNDIALLDLGVALEAQGRYDEALVFYRETEKMAANRYQLHNNMGNILGLLGHNSESLAEYRQAIALRPGNAFLHNAAGGELAVLGRFDEAYQEFSEAEKCNPTLGAPHFETAKVLFKQGRDAEGVKEFQAALRLEPENYKFLATTAHYLVATENDAVRDGKNALPLAIKANVLSGQNQPVVFDILGMAFAENGDFTNAIACAQNALELATAVKLKSTNQIQARLELYQKNLPWRESFLATNAPAAK